MIRLVEGGFACFLVCSAHRGPVTVVAGHGLRVTLRVTLVVARAIVGVAGGRRSGGRGTTITATTICRRGAAVAVVVGHGWEVF